MSETEERKSSTFRSDDDMISQLDKSEEMKQDQDEIKPEPWKNRDSLEKEQIQRRSGSKKSVNSQNSEEMKCLMQKAIETIKEEADNK